MSLDKKIIKEIERHRKINQYILEQVGAAPEEDVLGALAPAPEYLFGCLTPSTE